MKTVSNKVGSISTFSIQNAKYNSIEEKNILERIVENMVLIEKGIYLQNKHDIITFKGKVIRSSKPQEIEMDSFYISKYLITQKEWVTLMKYDPSEYQVEDEDLPVFNVNYEDCLRFIVKLNRMTGLKFDLPTSLQWDYAAHGGKANNYNLNSKTYEEICQHAWVDINTPFPIGLKTPNPIGLYDMFGNVGELCKRITSKDIIKGGIIQNERIWESNGFYHYEEFWDEEKAPNNIGFRLVCNETD